MEPMDQRVLAQSLQETPCTVRGWRRHTSCWGCSDHQNRRQEQREVAAGNHREFDVGNGGVVRGAKLRAGKSYVERAIQQLYPLELSCDRQTSEVPLVL